MTDYLTIIEIAAIHQELISQYGGADGIRDKGALDSACNRPQCGYYNDLFEEAAALMESLAMNHPFVDGNKRIAFAATYIFLKINGIKLAVDPIEAYQYMMRLFETETFTMEEIKPFLEKYSEKIKS